eukprot:m.61777 g.61777  ORF g.61777 m.61777 type:complete len:461 (-) comp13902_c0_seq3:68-1450(-)
MRLKRPSSALLAAVLICGNIITLTWLFTRQQIADSSVGKMSWQSRQGRELWDTSALPLSIDHNYYLVDTALATHKPHTRQRRLTIGIPTIYRSSTGHSYLMTCLDSLLSQLEPEQRTDVLFLIFVADTEAVKRQKVTETIAGRFSQYIEADQLRVIQAPSDFYPEFINVREAFHDAESRWKWRQKQCVDYSFMMSYAYQLSPYYLQLEDDVTTVPGYLNAIFDFIDEQEKPWIMLEYSLLGFIGKLFHDESLPRLAWMFRTFWQDQPVDFLIRYFVALSGLKETRVIRQPTLFEHIGVQSSLEGKAQNIQDQLVSESSQLKRYDGNNPPADVSSNMQVVGTYFPRNCYSRAPGAFWALAPHRNDHLTLSFIQPQSLRKVVVETGNEPNVQGEHDILTNGVLEAAFESQDSLYRELATFVNGKVAYEFGTGSDRVIGLRIRVLQDLQTWLMVREVAVWTQD